MSVSAQEVKQLREQTGAGIMDCKEALSETDGDMDDAAEWLREKGIESAEQKSGQTAEGTVGSYIHGDGRIGVLVEVNCETDFVANTEEFEDFVDEIAMQIAAQNPEYVSREEVPEDVLEQEENVIRKQFEDEDKPDHVLDDIVEGKLESSFYEEEVLLDQPYIRDDDISVQELLNQTVAEVDENINVRRFERFEVGEGIETEDEDFAEEVAEEIS